MFNHAEIQKFVDKRNKKEADDVICAINKELIAAAKQAYATLEFRCTKYVLAKPALSMVMEYYTKLNYTIQHTRHAYDVDMFTIDISENGVNYWEHIYE